MKEEFRSYLIAVSFLALGLASGCRSPAPTVAYHPKQGWGLRRGKSDPSNTESREPTGMRTTTTEDIGSSVSGLRIATCSSTRKAPDESMHVHWQSPSLSMRLSTSHTRETRHRQFQKAMFPRRSGLR